MSANKMDKKTHGLELTPVAMVSVRERERLLQERKTRLRR